tara:strand:+ start:25 stop:546 length:522 start_codon:yes stop_codon:yes gene_type:complete
MKKLLLLLLVPLLNSCSKGDDSSIGNFFENQSGKIWSFTYSNDDRAPFTLYHSFSDGTLKTTQYFGGQRYCTEKFLGTINNISHPYLRWQCNITNEIIVNKSNELQIETIVTDPDGTLRYTYVITLKVNGDNLVGSSSDEGDDKVIGDGLIGGTIYYGNLDLDFTNCEIEYII